MKKLMIRIRTLHTVHIGNTAVAEEYLHWHKSSSALFAAISMHCKVHTAQKLMLLQITLYACTSLTAQAMCFRLCFRIDHLQQIKALRLHIFNSTSNVLQITLFNRTSMQQCIGRRRPWVMDGGRVPAEMCNVSSVWSVQNRSVNISISSVNCAMCEAFHIQCEVFQYPVWSISISSVKCAKFAKCEALRCSVWSISMSSVVKYFSVQCCEVLQRISSVWSIAMSSLKYCTSFLLLCSLLHLRQSVFTA